MLSFIAKKKADVISYTEATEACRSSSSASRALHQLIQEGMIEPQPKLLGIRYVTQYAVTPKGKQVSELALHLTELRSSTKKTGPDSKNLSRANRLQAKSDSAQKVTGGRKPSTQLPKRRSASKISKVRNGKKVDSSQSVDESEKLEKPVTP